MKKLTALAVLLVLALAAWWFGGPYMAVHGLSKAIEERDTARLERYVDFLACAAACAPSSTTIWYARPARM